MKKNTRNFIVLGGVIVVLAGAAAALLLTGGQEQGGGQSSAPASSATKVTLIGKTEEDLTEMKVTNKEGGYVLKQVKSSASISSAPSEDGEQSSSSGSDTVITYTVEGLGDLPLDNDATKQAAKYGYGLEASRDLGETDDLGQYGLSDPTAAVDVTFADGSTYSYSIGNATSNDKTLYYVCETGKNHVYTAGVDSILTKSAAALVSSNIFSFGTNDTDVDFTSLTLSGAAYPQEIKLTKTSKGYALGSGLPADESAVSSITTVLPTLTGSSVVAVFPDDAKKKELGLDTPAATLSFEADGKAYTLHVSAEKDGSRYAMREGVEAVYQISAGNSSWASLDEYALRRKKIFSGDKETILSAVITDSGAKTEVTVSRTKDEFKSTEASTVYSYTVLDSNGEKHNFDGVYHTFYNKLISAKILEDAEKPDGEPSWTLDIRYFDNETKDALQFYDVGNRRTVVTFNGLVLGEIATEDAQAIRSSLEAVSSEEYKDPEAASSASQAS